MNRIESIPEPICEKDGCGRIAKMQVVNTSGHILGNYCGQHAVPALRATMKEGQGRPLQKPVVPGLTKEATAR